MASTAMPWYNKDAYDDKDDEYYVDGVTEEEINVDDEFKSAEEYVAEYDDWF